MNEFELATLDTIDQFIQTAVFIDDQAFSEKREDAHFFNGTAVTSSFAKRGKICGVYKPENIEDVDMLANVASKADCCILDWQINLLESVESNVGDNGDEEEDDIDETRGIYTRQIIDLIIGHDGNDEDNYRVVIIYTGEVDLAEISRIVENDLKKNDRSFKRIDDFTLRADNTTIGVYAKPTPDSKNERFRHTPELSARVVNFEEIYNVILRNFLNQTDGGLISNFILKSLTSIRKNTSALLGHYNDDLSAPYIVHRALLPVSEDAEVFMLDILAESIKGIINESNASEAISVDNCKLWIDHNDYLSNLYIDDGQKQLTKGILSGFISEDGIGKTLKKKYDNISKNSIQKTEKDIVSKKSSIMIEDSGRAQAADSKFYLVNHHKTIFNSGNVNSMLSLGTILKSDANDEYWLCVQPKCDCVRLVISAKFLFAKLSVVEQGGYDIVVYRNGYVKLKLVKNVKGLKTIVFNIDSGKDRVLSKKGDVENYYVSNYDEKFILVSELKEGISLNLASNLYDNLSRIGIDSYEAVRRIK